jgi:hypothetical protein
MRRESSTVVVLVGEVGDGLLAGLGRAPNVSVARARPAEDVQARVTEEAPRPGWEAGAAALREAARRRSTYVIVPDDPLADVAQQWRAMWDVPGGSPGAAGFEQHAADVLAAWRGKRFELPDYYLVMATSAQPGGTGPDLYLGPLRSARPRRVAVAGSTDGLAAQVARVLDTLSSLEYGPWWPPLDELLDTARRFYAGGLAETQPAPAH